MRITCADNLGSIVVVGRFNFHSPSSLPLSLSTVLLFHFLLFFASKVGACVVSPVTNAPTHQDFLIIVGEMKNKPTKDGIPGEQRQVEEQLQVVLNIAEGSIPEVVGHIEVANRH